MKRILFLTVSTVLACNAAAQQTNPVQYADPMTGTAGHGHTFPGATVPFGMVQLSPDTRIDGSWDGCSGYHYSDSVIYGFSHTHLSGTGCSDYGDIVLMPFTGEATLDLNKFKSGFAHKDEKAMAGFYSVKLSNGVEVELTSTTRVGFHRYKFPEKSQGNVVIDLSLRDKTLESSLDSISPTRLEGMRRSQAWANDQHIYFAIEFSSPFRIISSANEIGLWQGEGGLERVPNGNKMCLQFNTKLNRVVMVKVGISTVSIEGARKNLEAELKGWDFEKTKRDASALWNKELGKIGVMDTDKDKLKTFYTALYHTMIQPNVNMDVDGMYRGRDNKIHKAEGFTYYSVFSLWDTFRAAHPLYTIIDRKRSSDFINTFLAQYEQGGRLPVWELAGNETDCMIGYHSVSVIADAMVKGIKGFDYEKAFEASKHSAMLDHFGLKAYKRNGFISMDDEHESVSKTLEYAYDDWCISQMAKILNKENEYADFTERSQSWKNVFDPQTGFMRPKKNGGWLSPFDPREVNNNFTEGNSWQYTFFVPQDVPGLIAMMGGKDKFEKKLDELFSTSTQTTGREQADITGLIGQYAHGNEPSHHMAYLYNYVNASAKTELRVHQVMTDFYKPAPDGLIGNEDCGQMSAWYVLNALGIYQVTPGTDKYLLGTPLFKSVKLHLENGKTFSVNAANLSETNFYVQSRKINDQLLSENYISYASIMNGDGISFAMGGKPATIDSPDWTASLIGPPSFKICPVPSINAASRVFDDSLLVKIEVADPTEKIYYSVRELPGDKGAFEFYSGPFAVKRSSKVIAFSDNSSSRSDTVSGTFYKRPNHWKLSIRSKYNPQYTAGGDDGIIDGLHGTENWRKGDWQGYQAQNFEAVVDLLKEQKISSVSSTYLQDTRAWIIFPARVKYSFSSDGINFSNAVEIENPTDAQNYDVQVKDLSTMLPRKISARYVKVEAVNYGKLPAWHQGAGGDAFIFIDEIEIK
ncbi:MAG: putative hybrid glycoside hydrolase, group 92(-20) family protein precursor [Bacteroidetes bacterium]|nr:putative hybrid glycoside hydrolase, group 92(-20) family protein precursor [Bacteroidota bacterium]